MSKRKRAAKPRIIFDGFNRYTLDIYTKQRARDIVGRRYCPSEHQTDKPEKMFRDLIQIGRVQIERRRGKPPLIHWLNKGGGLAASR